MEFLTMMMMLGVGIWGFKTFMTAYQANAARQPVVGQRISVPARAVDAAGTDAPWEVAEQPEVQLVYVPTPQAAPAKTEKSSVGKWLVPVLCILYIACPIDIIPDFIPVLGWGDDVVAGLIGLATAIRK